MKQEEPRAVPVPIAAADASPITFEHIAAFPQPGWHIPRQIAFSPDGRLVTYLKSEEQSEQMVLCALDLATGEHQVLVRAGDLVDPSRPISRAEELRRERQRQRIKGVTSYSWARRSPILLLPLGGEIFVRLADGSIRQLTDSDEPAIDPKLCDTGVSVAFARGRELHVVDVGSRQERALTRHAPAGVTRGQSDFNGQEEFGELSGLWWSPHCDRIAYLEVDERQVAQVPVMGFRHGPDLMHQRYPRAGGANPTVRLGVVSSTGGETVWVELPTGPGEEHYLGRLQWHEDGGTLLFQLLSRDQQRLRLLEADAQSGAVREIARQSDPAWVEFADLRMLPDGFVWTEIRDGHRHLVQRDSMGRQVAQLTSGPWDVSRIEGLAATGAEPFARVLFTANRDAVLDRRLYAVPIGGGTSELLSRHDGVHEIEAPMPTVGYFDLHSATDRLPQAVIYGLDGSVRGRIEVPLDDDHEELQLRPAELLTIDDGRGPALYGALLKPRRLEPGKRYPAIIMVYGGPGVQTVLNQYNPRLIWQHLADRGVVVLQVDNRGAAGYGHRHEAALYRRLGTVELTDQLRGWDYLAELPFVDAGRIGIYGHSYGGYMATLAMLKAPDRFKVGVAGSPVTDWRLYDTGYTERYLSTPADNPDGYAASELVPLAGRLQGKLLIIHALMDENVHFEHTARLIDALIAADKDFDLLIFPGERHGYRSPAARRYAYRRVVEYFAREL